MKAKVLGLIISLVAAFTWAGSANAITYTFDRTIGAGSVMGSFTTDGTLGAIADPSHFTSISITITAPNINGGVATSGTGSFPFYSGSGITATSTDLIFDFSQDAYFGFFTATSDWWCFDSSGSGCFVTGEILGTSSFTVAQSVSRTGQFVFASVPSATPLPAALPLFATGLGALGLLGWRRKRKAAAIAA